MFAIPIKSIGIIIIMILDILYKETHSKVQSEPTVNPHKSTSSERVKRSLVKTISWRIIGTVDTVIISYLITGGIDKALAIGGIELVSKMILYFFHERTWNSIKWGK